MEAVSAVAATAGLLHCLKAVLSVVQELASHSVNKEINLRPENIGSDLQNLYDELSGHADTLSSGKLSLKMAGTRLYRLLDGIGLSLEHLFKPISNLSYLLRTFSSISAQRVRWAEVEALRSTVALAQEMIPRIRDIIKHQLPMDTDDTELTGHNETSPLTTHQLVNPKIKETNRPIGLHQTVLQSTQQLDLTRPAPERKNKLDRIQRQLRIPNNQDEIHSRFHRERLPNTCDWLLQSNEYRSWNGGDTVVEAKPILWCHGPAGIGKTMLCSKVIDDLRRSQKTSSVVYFYMGHGRPYSALEVASSLLIQLCSLNDLEPSRILACIEKGTDHVSFNLDQILADLEDACHKAIRPCIVAIDGLDEPYMKDREIRNGVETFSRLVDSLSRSGIKLFITSRATAARLKGGRAYIELKVDAASNKPDVTNFVQNSIDKLDIEGLIKNNEIFKNEVKTYIVKTADGKFHWAVQQIQLVLNKTNIFGIRVALQRMLKQPPNGVNIYLENIYQQSVERRVLAYRTLLFLSRCQSPVSIQSIGHLIGLLEVTKAAGKSLNFEINNFRDHIPSPTSVIDSCRGLVTIEPGSKIINISQSDIERAPNSRWLDSFRYAASDDDIASALLSYMLLDDFSTGPCGTNSELDDRLRNFPLYLYACRHWGNHFVDAENARSASERTSSPNPPRSSILAKRLLSNQQHRTASSQIAAFKDEDLYKIVDGEDTKALDVKLAESVSALQLAARFGLHHICQNLIDNDRNDPKLIFSKDYNGLGPLHEAAKVGSIETVEVLLRAGASVWDTDKSGKHAVYYATEGNHLNVVNRLEREAPQSSKLKRQFSPLSQAAYHGYTDMVKKRAGSASLEELQDALCQAAESGSLDVVQMLLEGGDHKFSPSDMANGARNGRPALVSAARSGNRVIVKVLLQSGADPNCFENNDIKLSALHIAIQKEHLAVAQLLLDYGVQINQEDAYGRTSLFTAVGLPNLKPASFLLFNGVDMSHEDFSGNAAIHHAASEGSIHIVELLLDQGVSVDTQNSKNGMTALMCAARMSYTRLLHLLISKYEANAKLKNKEGDTAIMIAIRNGNSQAMTHLLFESDLTETNNSAQSALDIVKNSDMERKIKEHLKQFYKKGPLDDAYRRSQEGPFSGLTEPGEASPDTYIPRTQPTRSQSSRSSKHRAEMAYQLTLRQRSLPALPIGPQTTKHIGASFTYEGSSGTISPELKLDEDQALHTKKGEARAS